MISILQRSTGFPLLSMIRWTPNRCATSIFVIYREVQAVSLWGAGIPVNVPAPERYALHKLLVRRLRIGTSQSQAKASKDIRQAGDLITVLAVQRPYELRDIWEELTARGPKWRRLAMEAVSLLDHATGSPAAREALEHALGNRHTR